MSNLGKTGALTILTAVPGSGKTLRTVWHIREALRKGRVENTPNLVYVCNLNGLISDGEFEGWIPFEDPTRWQELPPGSTLVVDEAQKFFRGGERGLPDYITAMETIRHSGITLILITQHPSFLMTHIQKLCTNHEHMVRENGEEAARIFRKTGIMVNVHSTRAMAKEDHEKWAYPTELYTAFKSAEIHTVKRVMKARTKRVIIALCCAGLLVAGACTLIARNIFKDESPAPAVAASAAPKGAGRSEERQKRNGWATPFDYAQDHLPRIGMMPWTAPIFDGRAVTADPIIVCASSLPGEGASGEWLEATCTCFTEQGTLYDLAQPECRTIARRGPVYNPYKQKQSEEMDPVQTAETNASVSAPETSVIDGDQGPPKAEQLPRTAS